MSRVHTPIPASRRSTCATSAHPPLYGVPTMKKWEEEREKRRAAAPFWRRLIGKS